MARTDVPLIGVEAGGYDDQPGQHASSLTFGKPGVLHGSFSYVLQDEDGQTEAVHSASAGLDYPGVGPEHSHWKSTGRVEYRSCRDDEALAAFDLGRNHRRDIARTGNISRNCQRNGSRQ